MVACRRPAGDGGSALPRELSQVLAAEPVTLDPHGLTPDPHDGFLVVLAGAGDIDVLVPGDRDLAGAVWAHG
jgi:hypothetical protein